MEETKALVMAHGYENTYGDPETFFSKTYFLDDNVTVELLITFPNEELGFKNYMARKIVYYSKNVKEPYEFVLSDKALWGEKLDAILQWADEESEDCEMILRGEHD